MSQLPSLPRGAVGPVTSQRVTIGRSDHLMARAAPIYLALLGAILTVIGLMLLVRLTHLLVIIFISALFAAAMTGPVDFLERWRIPRLISASLLQLAVVAVIAVGAWLVVPPLLDQGAGAVDTVPDRLQQYEGLQQRYDELRQQYPQLGSLDDQVSSIGERLVSAVGNRLVDLPLRIGQLLLDLLAISVISALLVAQRPRLQAFVLSLLRPHHRERANVVLDKMWFRLGRYVRAKLIVMAIIGAITFAALFFLDVRYPLLLAGIVALGEVIPQVGPWIARIPLFGIAALEGWKTFLAVVIVSVLIENLKGYLISPAVEGDQLDLNPLVVILAVLAGGILLGPIGALVAVPAAACIQVICEEVLIPWRRAQVETSLELPAGVEAGVMPPPGQAPG